MTIQISAVASNEIALSPKEKLHSLFTDSETAIKTANVYNRHSAFLKQYAHELSEPIKNAKFVLKNGGLVAFATDLYTHISNASQIKNSAIKPLLPNEDILECPPWMIQVNKQTNQIELPKGWKAVPYLKNLSCNILLNKKNMPKFIYPAVNNNSSLAKEIHPTEGLEIKKILENNSLTKCIITECQCEEFNETIGDILEFAERYSEMAEYEIDPLLTQLENWDENCPLKKEAEKLYQKIQAESSDLK